MTIQEIMTKTPKTCRPDDTLSEAVQLMRCNECGCLAVTASDGSGQLVGMITDRDICLAAEHYRKALEELRVVDAMATTVRACNSGDPLAEAEAIMREAQVRRLPVVDESEHVIGVISLADLAREARRERGFRWKEITDAEVGQTLAEICEPHEANALDTDASRVTPTDVTRRQCEPEAPS